jgi:hypothetical protein
VGNPREVETMARPNARTREARRPTARSVWNFVGLMAFVTFGLSYFGSLGGMYELVGGEESVRINTKVDARTWVAGAVISVLVFAVSRLAAKAGAAPRSAEAHMSNRAWNEGSDYSRAGARGALTFKRSPLAALRVTRSGPSMLKHGSRREGVTILSASLPAGDGASHPIGSCLAWHGVKGDLPSLSLVTGDFEPALMTAFGDDELDLAKYDLVFPWRAFGSVEACAEVFTHEMVKFLNSEGDEGVALHFEPHRVVAWSDRGDSIDQIDRLTSLSMGCVGALPRHLRYGGSKPSLPADRDSGERGSGERGSGESEKEWRLASLGDLRSISKIRGRLLTSFLVFGLFAVPPLVVLGFYLLGGVPFAGDGKGLLATGIIFALAVVTVGASWVSEVAMKRLDAKHEAIALQVRSVASDANLVFSPRSRFLEQGWTRRPFAALKNLGAAPSGSASREWGSLGVAYIEGDYGAWIFLVKPFQSRVAWAQVGGGLPRMDLVREGFSSRAAKLIGGSELDTESYDFNKLWRIKTDHPQEVHALLQPRMIEFLTTTAEQGIAIHLDDDRVVIWDDGSDETIDLAARLAMVQRFVECLPSHLRPTRDPEEDAR